MQMADSLSQRCQSVGVSPVNLTKERSCQHTDKVAKGGMFGDSAQRFAKNQRQVTEQHGFDRGPKDQVRSLHLRMEESQGGEVPDAEMGSDA